MNTDLSNYNLPAGYICCDGSPMAQCRRTLRIGNYTTGLSALKSAGHRVRGHQQQLAN